MLAQAQNRYCRATPFEPWSLVVGNTTRSGRWTLFWPTFYSHIAFALHSGGQSFSNDGLNEPRFLASRDGRNASYVTTQPANRARKSFVDLGVNHCSEQNMVPSRYPRGMEWCDDTRAAMDEESWDTSQVFLASGIVTTGDEHFMYFSGSAYTHGDDAQRPTWSRRNSGIGRLSIRKHGFASLAAGYSFPPTDKYGSYSASGLPTFFEIRDHAGAPVPGRTLAEADPIRGNFVAKEVKWQGSNSLSFLGGRRAVRVHGAMADAELFSLELACA